MFSFHENDIQMVSAFIAIHTNTVITGYVETLGDNLFFLNWQVDEKSNTWGINFYYYLNDEFAWRFQKNSNTLLKI